MLVLSRKKGETLMIGDEIELVVLGVEGDQVRLGIVAPKDITVFRKEVYLAIQSSNEEASQTSLDATQLSEMFKKMGKRVLE
jgi:carbon storage regulator